MRPRVLCLDGGGIRGLSEILILKELMLQVRIQNQLDFTPEPYECFDFICGTSTGGLLAVLIGRLGKTLNECEVLFRTLGSKIFEGGNFKQTLRMLSTGSKHTSKGLSEVIRGQAGDDTMHGGDATASGKVPVAVVTVSKTTHDDYLFRSYGVRAGDEACPIVDACLATSAATTFFPSVTINGVEYVDGAFRKNNPSSAALSELESADWPLPLRDAVTEVECLISVGTGRPTFKRANSSTLLKLFPGVGSLKDAATMCIKIATDCDEAHRAVEDRFRKANIAHSYYRFDVDRGLEAVELNESDSEALQMISAVTKSYLKGRQTEVERCARSLKPRSTTEISEPITELPPGVVFSGLPESTSFFVGRKAELRDMRQALDPSLPGRKSLLLQGIGGSGKTQLALRHIKEEGRRYSAVIWVNASTAEYAAHDFQEAAAEISKSWPRDMPVPQSPELDALSRVKARLRSTAHRNWLLVIDSAEDGDQNDLARYLPECSHGSVLVTSTKPRSFKGFRSKSTIHVEGLDHENACSLLFLCAQKTGDEDSASATDIVRDLSGIPLAIEQAGGLILNGEFTFPEFYREYKENYRSLMDNAPDEALWSYEKNRVILTILDMAHSSLKSRTEDAALFNLLTILGSWQVPISLLDEFNFFDFAAQDLDETTQELKSLRDLFGQPQNLRLALRRLSSFCLVRLTEQNNHIESLMIHRIICRWSMENQTTLQRTQYVMQAAHGLAGAVYQPRPQPTMLNALELDSPKPADIQRKYFTPFKHAMCLISEHVEPGDLDPYSGRLRPPYTFILREAARAHLLQGFPREAMKLFESTIKYGTIKASESGLIWPGDEDSLRTMCEFSRACHKSGDFDRAIEVLESVLPLSQKLLGNENETTLSIMTRLKELYIRRDTMEGHHKTALVGSLTDVEARKTMKTSRSDAPEARQNIPEDEAWARQEDLINAVRSGDVQTVQALFELPEIRVDRMVHGWTPLCTAASSGHVDVVKHLLEAGANVEQRIARGSTPLHAAVQGNRSAVVCLLLEKGADIEAKLEDEHGYTPLLCAAALGHTHCIETLINSGADIHAEDISGRTALMLASEKDHRDAVEQLMKRGLDTGVRDVMGRTLLHSAARASEGLVLEFLLKNASEIDINSQERGGKTPLHEACRFNKLESVELLVAAGARCDMRSSDGRDPCEIAHIMSFNDIDEALRRAETYHYACFIGLKKTLVEFVLSEPLNLLKNMVREATARELNTPSDTWIDTPLLNACRRGLECVKVLLDAGADPNGANCLGLAPMYEAVQLGDVATVQVLVQYGADVETSQHPSLSLWEHTLEMKNDQAMVLVLLRHGASIKKNSPFIQLALCIAVVWDDAIVTRRLVEAGASITLRLGGKSAVDTAFLQKSNMVLDYFASLDDDFESLGAGTSAGTSGGA